MNQKIHNKFICAAGEYCLELNDKDHSSQFQHLKPVTPSMHHSF
jgi:hypothetical protein